MPPARPRALDDSRSETSSTIGNIKDRNALSAAVGSTASKTKRATAQPQGTALKPTVNGVAVHSTGPLDADPSQPRTDWTTISPSILHTYRTAYKLATPSSYTHPHADLIYTSSRTALRSPSAVFARSRLRDLKHQRRKVTLNGVIKDARVKIKSRDKEKERDKTTNDLANAIDPILKPATPNDAPLSPSTPTAQTTLLPPGQIRRQPPSALATAVRKHFNAQQLSEAETVARFAYVVRQSRIPENVSREGSNGDGEGWWMGSQGREVRRGDGGEVGFRLRFRP